ncbi:endonuclease domain-containing protein [Lacunimicrobium album]
MTLHFQDKEKTKFARKRRTEPTESESLLWSFLRNRKLSGFKFRREAVIEPYVVDFLCQEQKLVIEIDGSSHDGRVEYDLKRETELKQQGYLILRFSHQDILSHLEGVLNGIERCLKDPERLKQLQSH